VEASVISAKYFDAYRIPTGFLQDKHFSHTAALAEDYRVSNSVRQQHWLKMIQWAVQPHSSIGWRLQSQQFSHTAVLAKSEEVSNPVTTTLVEDNPWLNNA